jgi:hypothetical protein
MTRASGRRCSERGAMAALVMLGSVVVGVLGVAGAVAFAVGAQAARAQNLADAVAHDVEVQLLELPPWVREDLSARIQADAGTCAGFATRVEGAPPPDADCEGIFVAARGRLTADSGGQAELLGLVLGADTRDFGNGRGSGRLEVVAFVAVRRHLPGCEVAMLPAIGPSNTCWAQAQAAAHAA